MKNLLKKILNVPCYYIFHVPYRTTEEPSVTPSSEKRYWFVWVCDRCGKKWERLDI